MIIQYSQSMKDIHVKPVDKYMNLLTFVSNFHQFFQAILPNNIFKHYVDLDKQQKFDGWINQFIK